MSRCAEVEGVHMANFSAFCGRTAEVGCCHGLCSQVHHTSVCCEWICFRSCVSVLWVLFSALAYLFNSLWEVSHWPLMRISLNRKNWCDFPQFQNRLFITFQCTVSSVSLLLGETVLQTVELLLLKYLQGKRRKDEQEVLIASNWGEECRCWSAATFVRAA